MKRILAATTIAAVALFFWGFIYWAVLEPALGVIQTAPDETALAASLSEHLKDEGTYMIPRDTTDMEALTKRHTAGPLVTIMFHPQGAPLMDPSVFAAGFAHMWISVFLMALLLRWISRFLGSYRQRLGFVVWIGVIEAVFSNLGRPIWYFQPWGYHLFEAGYAVTSWALVGLILAWFLHGDT